MTPGVSRATLGDMGNKSRDDIAETVFVFALIVALFLLAILA